MTNDEVKVALALAEKATPGLWMLDNGDCSVVTLNRDLTIANVRGWAPLRQRLGEDGAAVQMDANGEFIAAARTLVPDLARDLLAAREEAERWQQFAVWLHEGPDDATEEARQAVKELIAKWNAETTPETQEMR